MCDTTNQVKPSVLLSSILSATYLIPTAPLTLSQPLTPTYCLHTQLPTSPNYPLPAPCIQHTSNTDRSNTPPIGLPSDPTAEPSRPICRFCTIISYHNRIASPPVGFLKLRIDYYYYLLYCYYYTSHTAPVRSRRRRRRPVLPPAKTVAVQINAGSWVELGIWMDRWFLTVLVLHICSRWDD